MVTVSIYIKKDIYSIIFIRDGKLVSKTVAHITDDRLLSSSYLSLIDVFKIALRLVRNYLEENKDCDCVTFELSNSIFIKWIDNCFSKEAYQDDFMEAMKLLNKIPMRYSVVYNQKQKCMQVRII